MPVKNPDKKPGVSAINSELIDRVHALITDDWTATIDIIGAITPCREVNPNGNTPVANSYGSVQFCPMTAGQVRTCAEFLLKHGAIEKRNGGLWNEYRRLPRN